MSHSSFFPHSQNEVIISGPAGKLEAVVMPPLEESKAIFGIVCHPHPLYGGTMNNKVVTTVARTFHELGAWNIRFNFRGVGRSEGSYAHGDGEIEDLLAVIQWVTTHFPGYKIWLAGFSFGAYVAMQGAVLAADKIAQLITIAPAVNHFEFTQSAKIFCPWLLLMGEADEVVPVSEVKEWAKTQSAAIQSVYFPGVSHFFHGHLGELREQLKASL